MNRSEEEQGRLPLWQYVPLTRFQKPAPPAKEALRKGLRGLWDKLRPSPPPAEQVVKEKSLRPLPGEVMDRIAPPPDWRDLLPALTEALKGWVEGEKPGVAAVVGPPYSAVSDVVRLFAESHQWRILEAPEAQDILEGEWWLERVNENEKGGLAIPTLERFYLRHRRGLRLLRNLLGRLSTTKTPALVGLDSWAWAYLCKALGIDDLVAFTLTLQALDANALERWFFDLISQSCPVAFHCRDSNSGKPVLSLHSSSLASTDGKPAERTDFLEHVASYSHGIPGIAWSLWRHSLRLAARDDVEAEAREAAAADGDRTVWVKPWPQIRLPGLPAPAEQNQLFMLHALLLHGGLALPLLSRVLPLPHHELTTAAQRLQKSALIEERQGIYRVTPLGYPAVVECLRHEGYLASPI